MIAARNAFLMSGAGPTPPLPYDAEVEYLESNRAQWVDTGVFYHADDMSIEVDFVGLSGSNFAVFGADNGNTYTAGEVAFLWDGTYMDIIYPTGANSSDLVRPRPAYAHNQRYVFSLGNGVATIDGQSIPISAWYYQYVGTRTLYIFATHRNTAVVPSQMRLYHFAIRDGAALIRNLIPVRVGSGSSAVGYLYDRANPTGGPLGNGLYGNAGTGAFVIGPDKT